MTPEDLDGIDMSWGNGEAALELTIKMGEGDGCGEWLGHGVARASEHFGKGTDEYAVHVHGQEPAYHDPRFSSLMGVTYIADPTPGRHTAGSASWNETFGVGFALQNAVSKKETTVKWKGTEGKGLAQAHHSNSHQVMNGLGLCMFTALTGTLPWLDLVNALTGWDFTEKDLMALRRAHPESSRCIQPPRGNQARRLQAPSAHDGPGRRQLAQRPARGVQVPLHDLRRDYFDSMSWDSKSGHLSQARAEKLGIHDLLEGYLHTS